MTSSSEILRSDFGAASSSKEDLLRGLPDPFAALNDVQRQHLLPFTSIISSEPTKYVLVVPTNGDAFKAIKDTANGTPYGGSSSEKVTEKFTVAGIEFLHVNQSTKKEGGHPAVVHLENEVVAKKFLETLPFSYVAASFAKENSSKIFAGDWDNFVMRVTNGVRFSSKPPLAAKIYHRDREMKAFNQDLAWVARPSTTTGWLNRPSEL